ncbi:MAG: hypothetical protein H7144_08710 [Burkholderiales bacterium]|nr:hypothetical protein [Phycisphaerae bacterium]
MHRFGIVTLAALLTITIARLGLAQALPPQPNAATKPVDPPGAPAVRSAVREFVATLDATDLTAARGLFAGTEDGFKLIEGFHHAIKAAQRAKDAMTRRFPEEVTKRPAAGEMSVASMLQRLESEPVTIDADTANVGRPVGGLTLKQTGGKWRVTSLINDPQGQQRMNQLMPIIAQVSDEVAAEVDAGKYKTMIDAEKGFALKMRIGASAILKSVTSQPATSPPASTPPAR